jgi:hypothetical protein
MFGMLASQATFNQPEQEKQRISSSRAVAAASVNR